jgi:nucleotide-binding universal stress UspA family protein
MLPIRTILHPTDFSARSDSALKLACALARDYGARLIVLHSAQAPTIGYMEGVVPPLADDVIETARQQLERLEIPDTGGRVARRFEVGDPAESILEVAQEVHADLIAMGTHGRTGLARLLMGSVAEKVVRRATCPVLTLTAPFAVAETAPVLEPAVSSV